MKKTKKMWAWYDIERDEYAHLYTKESTVRMCRPDSFKAAEERGEGKVVKVIVKQVCSICGSDSGHYFYCPARKNED